MPGQGTAMAYKKRRRAATSPIDKALAKSDAEFVKDYLEPACVPKNPLDESDLVYRLT